MSQSASLLQPMPDGLVPAAMRARQSRGRHYPEAEHPFRNVFQRDRDRIIHAASFRRLEYKTQVFVNGEGDNYRTRLTHTLEVTQISRTMARALHLNEDLTEAVALSHDLGHTPFGHAGERVLNSLMEGKGGFNHNFHGLRVVDVLEKCYAAFDGLNLTFETREAFVRHGGGQTGGEFSVDDGPLLEVACTILADDIAYIAHDIDDGLYSGILDETNLRDLELWRMATIEAFPGYASLPLSLKRVEGVRRLINMLVSDAIAATREGIAAYQLLSEAKVRATRKNMVSFSEKMEKKKNAMKKYLFDNFYRHPNLIADLENAQKKLIGLFKAYTSDPDNLSGEYRKNADKCGLERAAADYIAGMTDRFAGEEYARIYGKS